MAAPTLNSWPQGAEEISLPIPFTDASLEFPSAQVNIYTGTGAIVTDKETTTLLDSREVENPREATTFSGVDVHAYNAQKVKELVRDMHLSSQASGSDQNSQRAQQKQEANTWYCHRCHFNTNYEQRLRCHICKAPRGTDVVPLSSTSTSETKGLSDTAPRPSASPRSVKQFTVGLSKAKLAGLRKHKSDLQVPLLNELLISMKAKVSFDLPLKQLGKQTKTLLQIMCFPDGPQFTAVLGGILSGMHSLWGASQRTQRPCSGCRSPVGAALIYQPEVCGVPESVTAFIRTQTCSASIGYCPRCWGDFLLIPEARPQDEVLRCRMLEGFLNRFSYRIDPLEAEMKQEVSDTAKNNKGT